MGSSSSHLGSRPSRSRLDRVKRKRSFSRLFCRSSVSGPSSEMEDCSSESLRSSLEVVSAPVNVPMSSKEPVSIFTSENGCSSSKSENGVSSESSHGLLNSNTKFTSGSSKILPPQVNGYCGPIKDKCKLTRDKAIATSKELAPLELVSLSATGGLDMFVDSNNLTNRPPTFISAECTPSSSEAQELESSCSTAELVAAVDIDFSDSISAVSDSSVSLQTRHESASGVSVPGTGLVVSDGGQDPIQRSPIHTRVVSNPSNTPSGSVSEVRNHEARRNDGSLFPLASSRRHYRRRIGGPTIIYRNSHIDELGSHDRWLIDFSGVRPADEITNDSRPSPSRSDHDSRHPLSTNHQQMIERQQLSRNEDSSANNNHDEGGSQTSLCASGLHPDGSCSCHSSLMAELSSTRASISRIIMLAEALYEVLDEIHSHPVSLSSSMHSLAAPEEVVNSFTTKNYKKSETTLNEAQDAEQCYICLAEYEEGDEIRVLPCCHEYHIACIDKWLKEMHSVCPVCRGDVCKGIAQAPIPDPETPFL